MIFTSWSDANRGVVGRSGGLYFGLILRARPISTRRRPRLTPLHLRVTFDRLPLRARRGEAPSTRFGGDRRPAAAKPRGAASGGIPLRLRAQAIFGQLFTRASRA